jgi:tRNA A37 threonylcarbamoyladenosine modification protein TsaB
MAAAKGLALSIDRPLIGISCFDAVARRATIDAAAMNFDILLLALASKREEIFIQGRDGQGMEIIPGRVMTPLHFDDEFGPGLESDVLLYLAGEAANGLADTLRQAGSHSRARLEVGPTGPPNASDIAALAHEILATAHARSRGYETGLAPVYMRSPFARAPDQ